MSVLPQRKAVETGDKSDLESRLDGYFATLRSSSLKQRLKRSIENWHIYAAVSGSAMAMATGAAAPLMTDGGQIAPERTASVRMTQRSGGSSKAPPLLTNVRIARAIHDAGQRFL